MRATRTQPEANQSGGSTCRQHSLLRHLASRLRRNEDGAAAMEFALVAPVLMLLTFGTLEVGLAMLAQEIMESATFSASRLGKTGYSANGNFEDQAARQQAMLEVMNRRASILLDTSKITITAKAYNQFDQIGQPEPFIDANGNGVRDDGENYTDVNMNGEYDSDMGKAGMGNSKQVVVYTINYPWQILTPFMGRVMGQDGVLQLSARTVVQNEPY